MKKSLLPLLAVLSLVMPGCDHSGDGGTAPVNITPKTCVQFVNDNSFPVSVYADSSQYQRITYVGARSSSPLIERTAGEAHFYQVYHLALDGWEFPYYDEGVISEINEGIIARVDAGKTTAILIPPLSAFSSYTPITNKTYLLCKNASSYSLVLTHGNSEENPQERTSPIVNAGETVRYLVSAEAVSNYQFKRNTVTPVEFPPDMGARDAATGQRKFEKGHLYTIKYENSGFSLISDIPLTIAQALASLPSAPLHVTASPAFSMGETGIDLQWDAVEKAAGYNVYRSDSAGGIYTKVNTSLITRTSYFDTGLTWNTAYYYKVSSVSAAGLESEMSAYAIAETVLPAPTGVTAAAENGYIHITWDSVSGALGYRVYRATSPGGVYSRISTTYTTMYDDDSVSTGTIYYYKVSAAVEISGVESALSDYVFAMVTFDAAELSQYSWYGSTLYAGEEHWYRFYANADTSYYIYWNDSDNYGYGYGYCDIQVSAYQGSEDGELLFTADTGYSGEYLYIDSYSGYIYLKVKGYSSDSSGYYEIMYQ